MAKTSAVWGIDIGQCALKALRCRPHEKDEKRIVIEAFDYIEYPKILTQPEADRDELIREALEQFIARNDLTDDRVAIAVPGQSGLARFIKLPPVESKKIPDIVKYEARQQIPFALEDVVWDYQPLVGQQDEGYALETEVGLFAMKRDQVARALRPLEEAGIQVDIIQLAPLAIYNFLCFDRMNLDGAYDPANPPASTVIISLGTDTTDLVITNGYRVWQRSIPIGGNHFTKALTKELKLTFAKAEHLKCNAMKAENPKAVFQAMRPVFSDLVAEIQRSIGFFTSNNRNSKLGETIALGNPMKLPGLQRYLSQNLDQEVKLGEGFNGLVGGSATASPQFKDNQLTFGVAYGLCVQALDRSQIKTNLLPEEIVTTRLVRAKKPWVVAAVALLLVGMTINYAGHYSAWTTANVEEPNMQRELRSAQEWVQEANRYTSDHSSLVEEFNQVIEIGNNLQSNVDGRLLWLEVLKVLDTALPRDERPIEEREETPEDVMRRPELHIESLECEHFADVSQWWQAVQSRYVSMKEDEEPAAGAAEEADFADPDVVDSDGFVQEPMGDPGLMADDPYVGGGFDDGMDPMMGGAAGGPSGEGWVIQLMGHHFHNADRDNEGGPFIRNTFFKNLENGTVKLPDGPGGELIDVPISELGLSHPVLVTRERIETEEYWPEPTDDSDAVQSGMPMRRAMPALEGGGRLGALGGIPGAAAEEEVKPWKLRRYNFIIHILWQPTPRGERLEKMAQGEDPDAMPTAAASGDVTDERS